MLVCAESNKINNKLEKDQWWDKEATGVHVSFNKDKYLDVLGSKW